jgi:predicted ferric reductase
MDGHGPTLTAAVAGVAGWRSGKDQGMRLAARGVLWIGLYLFATLAPLVVAATADPPPARAFWIDFSVALGFVGLAMMGMQFLLIARVKAVAAPFGQDALVALHRQMSFVALTFVVAHPLILFVADAGTYLDLLAFWSAPWRARFALTSVVLLLALMALSIWRKRWKISYELWQITHGVLAVGVIGFALAHINGVSYYVDGAWKRALWVAFSLALMAALVWIRLVKPIQRLRQPWRVAEVREELGRSTTLVLEPVGHPGFSFLPGQFGWVIVDGSPFAVTQHPFSLSSAGDVEPGGRVAFTIKRRGDFTNSIPAIAVGTRAYVDGPHGVFSPDLNEAQGFVLIAGGVGITPMHSIVATMAERNDQRPVWLFNANRGWDDITLRDELEALRERTQLTLVNVLEEPPDGWTGERGRITAEVFDRHLPAAERLRFQYFICGPGPMMDAMEDALVTIGIPPERIHTERFDMV